MSDVSGYKWYFDLVQFALTLDNNLDYRGIVRANKSLTRSDIAESISTDRTDLRKETIEMVLKLADEKIIEKVCSGNTVVTGIVTFQPTITGTFTGKSGTVDPAKNVCKVNVNTTSDFKAHISKVELEFTGYVKDLGGARVNLVTDTETDKIDGTITPGGNIIISGSKIKCVNADGTGTGIVRFVNMETGDITEVRKFAVNEPKKIVLIVPSALQSGMYTLQIETYFSTAKTLLKTARQISYSVPLVAGGTAVTEEESSDNTSTDE